MFFSLQSQINTYKHDRRRADKHSGQFQNLPDTAFPNPAVLYPGSLNLDEKKNYIRSLFISLLLEFSISCNSGCGQQKPEGSIC